MQWHCGELFVRQAIEVRTCPRVRVWIPVRIVLSALHEMGLNFRIGVDQVSLPEASHQKKQVRMRGQSFVYDPAKYVLVRSNCAKETPESDR